VGKKLGANRSKAVNSQEKKTSMRRRTTLEPEEMATMRDYPFEEVWGQRRKTSGTPDEYHKFLAIQAKKTTVPERAKNVERGDGLAERERLENFWESDRKKPKQHAGGCVVLVKEKREDPRSRSL